MTAMPAPDAGPNARIAWPTGVLFGQPRQDPAGYLMPRAEAGCQSLHELMTDEPGSAAARRLETAVTTLHEQEVVIGDLHPHNAALAPDGQLRIFDTDA